MEKRQERCKVCGEVFDPHQVRQKYCSHACQMRAWRARETSRRYTDTGETSHASQTALQRPIQARESDGEGQRLLRIWGQNRLSEIELRIMGLTPTGRSFPGGMFYLSD